MRRFTTVDENEIHHYTTDGKQQSEQWVSVGGTAPKRPKTQLSAGNATVFWDSQGIIFTDYFKKKTIN